MIETTAPVPAPVTPLDLDDIQGLILHGYGRMRHAAHLLLQIDDAPDFRSWLHTLTEENLASPYVTAASDWIYKPPAGIVPTYCVNLAFTHTGLAAVGLAAEHLATFPDDFRQGALARAGRVQDTGANDPQHWIEELRANRHADVHAVLSVFALDTAVLRDTTTQLLGASAGATLICRRDAAALYEDDRRSGIVHFGYRDGLSQPTIAGVPDYRPANREPISDPLPALPAGDFVLGLAGEYGMSDRVPSPARLARNGSYAALRILEQDVEGFERHLDRDRPHAAARELEAAKICGRWRSGTPLVVAPDADPGVPDAELNAFDFGDLHPDPQGRRCPLESHIRRSYPRRDPFVGGNPDVRRLIRRGMPYGPLYVRDSRDRVEADPGIERGLIGLFICASLSEQFEHVQRRWINRGAAGARDPLTGNNADPSAAGLPRFVTTRGGLYLFLPSMTALRYLADLTT